MNSAKPAIPLSNLVVDAACLCFAGWTVICNAAVLTGANTYQLTTATAAIGLFGLLALGLLVGRSGARSLLDFFRDDPEQPQPQAEDEEDLPWRVRILAIAVALAIGAAYYFRREFLVFWACSCLYFAGACWYASRSSIRRRPTARSLPAELCLWAIGLLCMSVTLSTRRYDVDDSFYINLGVGVAAFPSLPLLRFDTVHGIGLPIQAPFYRVHTFEALAGLLSHLTGIETIWFIHMLFAGIAGLLAPLAIARLLKSIDSERWLWALMVIVIFFLYTPGPHRSYACFAFIRLFQGKAIFLTVLVPLIAAYGIRLGRFPTPRNALFLAAAEIAGIGMTSSAIWLSPLIGAMAVASAFRLRPEDWKRAAYAVLCSLYVLGAGVLLFLTLKAGQGGGGTAAAASVTALGSESFKALRLVLGGGKLLAVSLTVVLLCWPLCRTNLARRFVSVFGLVFFLILVNPYLSAYLKSYLTGNTYWRILWALPFPVMAALCVTSPINLPLISRRGMVGLLVAASLVAAHYYRFPVRRRVRWGEPRLKVPGREYAVAKAINESLPPGSFALAPTLVSLYLPTFNRFAFPLMTKVTYVKTDTADRRRRAKLVSFVQRSRKRTDGYAWFIYNLNLYRVSGVAFSTDHDSRRWLKKENRLRETLSRFGFRKVRTVRKYEIWVRKLAKGTAPFSPVSGNKLRLDAIPVPARAGEK